MENKLLESLERIGEKYAELVEKELKEIEKPTAKELQNLEIQIRLVNTLAVSIDRIKKENIYLPKSW